MSFRSTSTSISEPDGFHRGDFSSREGSGRARLVTNPVRRTIHGDAPLAVLGG
jgi:hypothetical protein